MRFPKRLVPIQKTGASQPADHGSSCLDTFALGVVDDPCPVAAPVQAGGEPTRGFLGKSSRLTQQVDQRLLTALGDSEHVDLGDNSSVGTDDRHAVSLVRESATVRRHGTPKSHMSARQAPTQLRRLLVAGSPHGDTELPCGRERAYQCRSWSFSTNDRYQLRADATTSRQRRLGSNAPRAINAPPAISAHPAPCSAAEDSR